MKYTLLQLVQSVLGSIDGDEVDSYDDTAESLQVANIVRDTYYNIVAKLDAPEHQGYFELAATSVSTPTAMTIPSYASRIESIKYNFVEAPATSPDFRTINPLPVNEFFDRMHNMTTVNTDTEKYTITTTNGDTIDILYYNDRAPSFYTTFDDYYIIFDSILDTEDSYLVQSKTLCYGQVLPSWTFSDSFTPDLDSKQFQILLNESKELASAELRQSQNAVASRNARRHWINAQRTKEAIKVVPWYHQLPNYGRK